MLKFSFNHWGWVVAGIVFMFLVSGISAALEAYLDFKKRPTEEMYWCHKHGAFRKAHTLPLFPEMGGTAQNSFICPSCYYDTVFKDPNKRMN